MAIILHVIGKLVEPVAAVVDVALQLLGVGRATPLCAAVGPAEAGERTDAGRTLMIDDVVRIAAGVARRAVGARHARKADARAEVEQHGLEGAHVTLGLHHRLADRIRRAISLRDRAVEERDAVPALEIGGVGQHEVGVMHHLGGIGVRIDDLRDGVAAVRLLLRQIPDGIRHVHRRVPAHVGHVHEQDVDAVGVLLGGVGDDHMHHAVGGQGRIPAIGFVEALRRAFSINQQVFGRGDEAERRAGQRRVGLHLAGLSGGLHAGRRRLGEWRLVAEATRHIDGAEQNLQQMDGAAGLETVGMGRDAAHGVHRDGAAHHLLVVAAEMIRPRNVERDLLLEGSAGELGCDAPDGFHRNAAAFRDVLGRPFGIDEAFGDQREGGDDAAAVRHLEAAHELRRGIGRQGGHGRIRVAVPYQCGILCIANKQPIIGATLVFDDEPRRVGVAEQVFAIDLLGREELMDQRADEQAVSTGADADPFVRNCGVASADRIDRDDLGAARLQLPQRLLDGIGAMVLGNTEQQEILGVLPVGLAEFPERAAEGVESCRRHVDGAEAAVGGIVGRAELGGPPAREALALVAAGEEGELLRILGANVREPARGEAQRLVPLDFPELARAALADPQQRLRQAPRRIMLHDAGGTLAADDALVHWVVRIAVDIGDAAVLQLNPDATAAGAHVAGGGLHFVPVLGRGVYDGFGHALPA